jgi:hypothetical protein
MPIGQAPRHIAEVKTNLAEVMYYLYLPVVIERSDVRLPQNVECCREIIHRSILAASQHERASYPHYTYVYLSARKGWATPDNPLNRPGWHCDGFGTDDLNYVWWVGPGTRFAIQNFTDISSSHTRSLEQFEEQIIPEKVVSYAERNLYELTPEVVHATPVIAAPGCMRQYVKVSLSNERYNLENNSHNYLFDYAWPLHSREITRNDPYAAQLDYVSNPA